MDHSKAQRPHLVQLLAAAKHEANLGAAHRRVSHRQRGATVTAFINMRLTKGGRQRQPDSSWHKNCSRRREATTAVLCVHLCGRRKRLYTHAGSEEAPRAALLRAANR
jgi:hypothetical protein